MESRLKYFYNKITAIRKSAHWYIYTLLIFAIFSCTPPKSKLETYGPVFENVMRTDEGVFRGFSLGDSFDSIQSRETNKPVEIDSNFLYYEYKLTTTGSFNITYNFDERGLNEIQSDIFITNSADAEKIFNTFKSYFDQHYGANQSQMGISAWSVKSEKFGDVKINLSDESNNFISDKAPGKITLWIYRDKI